MAEVTSFDKSMTIIVLNEEEAELLTTVLLDQPVGWGKLSELTEALCVLKNGDLD